MGQRRRRPPSFRGDHRGAIWLALGWLLLGLAWSALAGVRGDYIPTYAPICSPLVDVGHQITPNLSGLFFTRFADIVVLLAIVLWILFGLLIVPRSLEGKRLMVLRRFFWIVGTLYFIRGFTVWVTLIPRPEHATPGIDTSRSWFVNFLLVFLQIDQTASDLMFSGHTALLVTIAWFFSYYIAHASGMAWLYTILGMYFILSTRHHYTVDILVAFTVSSLVFWVYHLLFDNDDGGHSPDYLSRRGADLDGGRISTNKRQFWEWLYWLHGQ